MSGGQQGVAVIEFALTLLFLLLLTVGITEIGRAFWYYSAIQKAARDGARCMSNLEWLNSSDVSVCRTVVVSNANSAGLRPALEEANVILSCDGNTACASSWGTGARPQYVTVTATHQMRWLWSIGGGLPAAGQSSGLRGAATMPYMK